MVPVVPVVPVDVQWAVGVWVVEGVERKRFDFPASFWLPGLLVAHTQSNCLRLQLSAALRLRPRKPKINLAKTAVKTAGDGRQQKAEGWKALGTSGDLAPTSSPRSLCSFQ